MNTRLINRLAVALCGLWLAAPVTQAQEYRIKSFRLDTGTTCTGGVYSTRVSLGCTDLGTMTGGDFTIKEGTYSRLPMGLWQLMIGKGGARAITWPIPENVAHLYYSTTVRPSLQWILIPPEQYQVIGVNVSVGITNFPSACFYRLQWP